MCLRTNPKKVGLVAHVPWESDSEDGEEDWFGDDDDEEEDEEGDEEGDEGGAEGSQGEDGDEDDGEGDVAEGSDDGAEEGEGEDEDEEEDDGTKVEVTWLAKNPWDEPSDTLEEPGELQVIDRAFLPGDIVGRINDPFGQSGTVVDVDLRLDIKLSSGEVLQNVPAKRVRAVHPFGPDVNVVKDGWLGTVYKCTVNLHVRFPDGSVCLIERAPRISKETGEMVDADDDEYSEDELELYYPTMEIFVDELGKEVVRNATWLSGAYRRNFDSGIVIKVEPLEVSVDWIAATFMTTGEGVNPPDHLCQPSELTVLNHYHYANWQIFDVALIDPEPQQGPEQPQQAQAPQPAGRGQGGQKGGQGAGSGRGQQQGAQKAPQSKYLAKKNKLREKKQQQQQKQKERKSEARCGIIMRTRTRVTVMWQDATREEGVPSVSLTPLHDLLDADFWPQDFVQEVVEIQPTDAENDERDIVTGKTNSLRKVMERLHLSSAGAAEDQPAAAAEAETTPTPTDEDQSAAPVAAKSRLGIVKKVDSAARTCVVRWLTGQHTKASEKAESENENEKMEVEEEESAAKNEDEGEEEEVSFYQIMIHPDFKYRLGDLVLKLPGTGGDSAALEQQESAQGQWVGELVGLRDGKLLVQWSDSTTSWVGPEQVYALDTDDDWHANDDEFPVDDEEGEEGEASDEEGLSSAAAAALTATGPNAGLMQSVISAATNWWADGIGSPAGAGAVAAPAAATRQPPADEAEEESEEEEAEGESEASESEDEEETKGATSLAEHVKAAADSDAPFAFLPADSDLEKLVIQHHRFRRETQAPTNQREWTAAVVKEWGLLKKSLPPGVYVRGFGSRMDLLKVLIIGSSGTPYVHSPFVFDVYLPPNYPHAPPLVHYCSVLNERFHPNLYETGKVCLSLLGTWEGKGVETWNPATSNLLQVVVSIQGLILGTAEPYYLEAGYEKFRGSVEGERKSKLYNESAFLLSFRAMSAILRNPPLPFQLVIRRYFADHAKAIVELCQPYLLEPVPIPTLAEAKRECETKEGEAGASKPPLTHTPSKGFCRALTNVFPRLVHELQTNQQQQIQRSRATASSHQQ